LINKLSELVVSESLFSKNSRTAGARLFVNRNTIILTNPRWAAHHKKEGFSVNPFGGKTFMPKAYFPELSWKLLKIADFNQSQKPERRSSAISQVIVN